MAPEENEPRDLSRERNDRERVQRSENIRHAREGRAESLEAERELRAQELAIEAALRQERINTRFVDLERQVAAINGSVRDAAANYSALYGQLAEVKDSVRQILAAQSQRDAVAVALRDAVEKANESQISNRMFISGVVAIIVTIVGLVVTQAHLLG